jgi:hypothetical protein
MSRVNPYAQVGAPARGDRFVGRQAEVQRVQGVRDSARPSNMSIIGNHKIGKSSLVHRSLVEDPPQRDDLAQVFLSIGTLTRPEDVFRMICRGTVRSIDLLGRHVPASVEALAAVEAEQSWYGLIETFKDFFMLVQTAGIKVLVVLDEFDRIRMDGVRLAHFQFLRDFCTESWSSAGLVTVSRQGVRSLEIGATGGSSLDQVLVPRTYVGLFAPEECERVLARGELAGLDLAPYRDRIAQIAGTHPYLTELLCYELVHDFQVGGGPDADVAGGRAQTSITEFFGRLLKIVDIDLGGSGVDKLVQVVTGVGLDVSPDDVLTLAQYGLIVRGADGQFGPFSEAFGRFLKRSGDGREFRGLWADCEWGLRRLIRTTLAKDHPTGDFRLAMPKNFDPKMEQARKLLAKARSGSDEVDELDYLYPSDLFQVITTRWSLFEAEVGGRRDEWQQYGEHVAAARNEVMHIRPLEIQQRLKAEAAATAVRSVLVRLGYVEDGG